MFTAGELVRHAAERHLRDMRDGEKRGIYWRPEEAAHFLNFLPSVFQVTDGPAAGEPFHPLEWHTFVGGSLFGWRTNTNRWRFRHGWLETGKGQAKSPLMGAIGVYIMGWCDISRAQCYAIGEDKATANVLFRDAAAMCRADIPGYDEGESLESLGEVVIRGELENAWKIEHPDSGSFFMPIASGEAQSGPRPSFVAGDEIHEFKSESSLLTWKAAIDKVAGNALMLLGTNTPATSQHVGTSYSNLYQSIAKGEARDDTAFAFIARVDKADRETVLENEQCWQKSLPALGETFPIENIRETVAAAILRPSTKSSVKRLYFGIDTAAADFWIDEEKWAAVQGPVAEKGMRHRYCRLALDLSQKNDLTALSAAWEPVSEEPIAVKTWYWTTEDGLRDRADRDKAPYVEWVEDGHLIATPGSTIDYTYVAMQVAQLCADQKVLELVVDPAFIAAFMDACAEVGLEVWLYGGPDKPEGRGLKIVPHAQGKRIMFEDRQLCMPHSITRTEDAILDQRIVIDSSPVTYSCAANAAIDADGQGNRAFDKKRSRGRIDGMVTTAMAVGAATATVKPKKKSVYASRGVRRL
ncbi:MULTISPECIES: terminase large subunit [unclassified Sphingobium]|uniref:terminase large subunit n=1 Tax=unclassified Sphingobium TaxID=2611147 RepID=UPI002224C990|nr:MULTISPECIES: terminase TerL endonuclease subunit [unclassified Sphingobium]MCW2395880.1 phage terminase large subunit-like protein [Sphingobium sp. B8D3B]MCW2419396.1 phage terminase large subunit-like protein [Sphingobium sp. B8D3C]